MQWNDTYAATLFSFANNINTSREARTEGFRGAHAYRQQLRPANGLITRATRRSRRRRARRSRRGHFRESSRAQFEGQTKTKSANSDVRGLVKH